MRTDKGNKGDETLQKATGTIPRCYFVIPSIADADSYTWSSFGQSITSSSL